MTSGLVWFRNDLRVQDNTALHAARQENDSLVALYIIDTYAWHQHHVAAVQVNFILRNLSCLQAELAKKNIPLLVYEINKSTAITALFESIITEYAIDALYFNEQYEFDEHERDQRIKQSLSIPVHSYTDQIIFAPRELLTGKNTPYTVFTPYKNRFINAVSQRQIITLPSINSCADTIKINQQHKKIPQQIAGFATDISADYWPAGEKAAHHRLHKFIATQVKQYQTTRDFPAEKGTSKLSAYLSCGVLSTRQCFAAAIEANHGKLINGNKNIDCWLSELIWREFYKQILANFPRVSKNKAFKLETEKWPWKHDKKLLAAWQNGQTGYPLIDAAMRQLQQTGWMHNRLRMVVAMFLTKDCFLDWRLGEKFFMQHLIDGDLAANNGGWQWAASTGCDAVPYFRVFNPVRQSERFDPQGIFIKMYCPELAKVPLKQLHDPFKLPVGLDYPPPIVDYRQTRQTVITAIKALAYTGHQ
jgi:deoxyribodipyrimidine photo-lyase